MTIDNEVEKIAQDDRLTRLAQQVLGEREPERLQASDSAPFLFAAYLADINSGARKQHYARIAGLSGSHLLDDEHVGEHARYTIRELTNTYLEIAGLSPIEPKTE